LPVFSARRVGCDPEIDLVSAQRALCERYGVGNRRSDVHVLEIVSATWLRVSQQVLHGFGNLLRLLKNFLTISAALGNVVFVRERFGRGNG